MGICVVCSSIADYYYVGCRGNRILISVGRKKNYPYGVAGAWKEEVGGNNMEALFHLVGQGEGESVDGSPWKSCYVTERL